jgi:hypothetical protein
MKTSSVFLNGIIEYMQVRRYAKRTIETYIHWIKQYILFNHKQHPDPYQYTALTQSNQPQGAAISIGGEPNVYLKSINTDVLRKEPVQPFIEQDEWRIVVFTNGYYKNDPMEPLDIFVEPSHFYEYLPSNK